MGMGLMNDAALAQAQKTAPFKIVALGDSLVAGYGLQAQEAFPAQLERALKQDGHNVRVINAGVSGDTTAGGLARVDWALADKPDLVILSLGANDMLRGLDPKVTRDNLDKLLTRIKASGAKVLLAGMYAAPTLGNEYGRAFNAIYADLARKHDVALYPFFLDGVAAQAALNLADGMHPNPKGIAVIVKGITPHVERLLPPRPS